MTKVKKITIILMDLNVHEFENANWNNSNLGISINTDDKRYYFYPMHNVYSVYSVME